ncbi:MAG TPA: helix-turn-helix transcriptional regulator [Gemmataceae bacterium]|nr:helix-turn-helix transcriptional regulator [Gemmataceae bacterium]
MSTMKTAGDWFCEGADGEVEADISVGGLAVRLAAQERQERSPELAAVGKMIELRRREKGLSAEDLARQAHMTDDSLFDLERGVRMPNSRDVIVLVAEVLDLPGEKLLMAAGLSGATAPDLSSAALQCAAQAKPPERLSPPENAALVAFMEALAVK